MNVRFGVNMRVDTKGLFCYSTCLLWSRATSEGVCCAGTTVPMNSNFAKDNR